MSEATKQLVQKQLALQVLKQEQWQEQETGRTRTFRPVWWCATWWRLSLNPENAPCDVRMWGGQVRMPRSLLSHTSVTVLGSVTPRLAGWGTELHLYLSTCLKQKHFIPGPHNYLWSLMMDDPYKVSTESPTMDHSYKVSNLGDRQDPFPSDRARLHSAMSHSSKVQLPSLP